ncbi:hypothetical protein ZWY2020_032635 [Hordeum vulgare]|nr:hypothetical protein ZWY2020_032635 [Hordeum vulgare]
MALFLFSPAEAPPSRPPAGRSPPPAAPPPSEPPNPSSLPRATPSLPCLLLASPLSTRRPQLADVRESCLMSSDSNVYEDHDDPSGAKHCRHRLNQAKERRGRRQEGDQLELARLHCPPYAAAAEPTTSHRATVSRSRPPPTKKTPNSRIPNYPSLPSQLLCQVHNITMHADKDTDEVYAQMTLQPVNSVSTVKKWNLVKKFSSS